MFIKTKMQNISVAKRFRSFNRSLAAFTVLSVLALGFIMCQKSSPTETTNPVEKWVGTWNCSQQLVEPGNMPPAKPGLTNNSLRQIVRVSIGGERIRVKFSNEFSTSPVTLKEARIAVSVDASVIDTETDTKLLFAGAPEVTMAPGTAVTSDPIDFTLAPRSNVTITILFGDTSPDVTGHPGSRTTSYLFEGNKVAAGDFIGAKQMDHWYVINGIDVVSASGAAVAVLGNSITDGRGSGTNKQNRWTDELARRLQENAKTQNVAVLNEGLGGNCVLRDCLGPAAINRFERDIVNQAGVRWAIILEGVNDLGQAADTNATAIANDLIAAYEQMVITAHANNILVYGATILPFGESFYDTDAREAARQQVNTWIRAAGHFDGVIDFDAAMRKADDPTMLQTEVDGGDHLHPNEAGYVKMAETVDLTLFE
ncbi:MAG TPA: SGNH/GDSL hydrolase family protein [bacterium]|nr:SGNH/GDSL hydrolase family protein [bacterium]HPN44602.1 SGNH/GDSL hydrolase family protein [bacterium]